MLNHIRIGKDFSKNHFQTIFIQRFKYSFVILFEILLIGVLIGFIIILILKKIPK